MGVFKEEMGDEGLKESGHMIVIHERNQRGQRLLDFTFANGWSVDDLSGGTNCQGFTVW